MTAKAADVFTDLVPDAQGMCHVPISRLEQMKPNRDMLRFVSRSARVRKPDGKTFSFCFPDKRAVLEQTGYGALLLLDFVRYLGIVCVVLGAVATLIGYSYNVEATRTKAIFRGQRPPPLPLTRAMSYTPHAAEMFLYDNRTKSLSDYWEYSVGAHQYSTVTFGTGAIITVITALAMVGRLWIQQRLERNEKRLNRKIMTPSDYTASLSRFPRTPGKFTEEHVAAFCSKFGTVRQVTIGYSTGKLGAYAREVQEIDWRVQELEILRSRNGDKKFVASMIPPDALRTPSAVIKKLQKRRETLVERIRKRVEGSSKVHRGSGTVLVTFDRPREAAACISGLSGFWRRMAIRFRMSVCMSRSSKFLGHYVVMAQRADEPADVYWHNLQYGRCQRLLFSLSAGTHAWILTGVAALAQYGGYFIRHWSGKGLGGQALNFMVSVIVAVIQGMVLNRIEAAASSEHHPTRSAEFASIARKQTRVTLLLSGLVLLLVNAHSPARWPTSSGLLGAAFSQLVSNALQGPIKSLGQSALAYYGKKFWVLDQARTQLALLEAADPPELKVVSAFSDASGVFCIALFFTPIMPAGLPIAAVGMILRYFILRYQLLRLCKKPPFIQGVVCKAVSLAMLEAIRISALTSIAFFALYTGSNANGDSLQGAAIGSVAAGIAVFGMWTPFPKMLAACFNCRKPRRKGLYQQTALENMDRPLAETIGVHKLYSCPPARELLQQVETVSKKTIRVPYGLLSQTKVVEMLTMSPSEDESVINPLDTKVDADATPEHSGV